MKNILILLYVLVNSQSFAQTIMDKILDNEKVSIESHKYNVVQGNQFGSKETTSIIDITKKEISIKTENYNIVIKRISKAFKRTNSIYGEFLFMNAEEQNGLAEVYLTEKQLILLFKNGTIKYIFELTNR